MSHQRGWIEKGDEDSITFFGIFSPTDKMNQNKQEKTIKASFHQLTRWYDWYRALKAKLSGQFNGKNYNINFFGKRRKAKFSGKFSEKNDEIIFLEKEEKPSWVASSMERIINKTFQK